MLNRDPTSWATWVDPKNIHRRSNENDRITREQAEEEDTHVGHVLGEVRRGKRAFKKTPKTPKGMPEDACRIFGSLEGNKVQGDFHITARGHGYMEFGEHLSHECELRPLLHPYISGLCFCVRPSTVTQPSLPLSEHIKRTSHSPFSPLLTQRHFQHSTSPT